MSTLVFGRAVPIANRTQSPGALSARHPLLMPRRLVLLAVLCAVILPLPCGCGPAHGREAKAASEPIPTARRADDTAVLGTPS